MQESAEQDPLFIGMTRPPLVAGVPMELFGICFILFGIGMVAFTAFSGKILFVLLTTLPLHAIGYIATERDPHWMKVWLIKFNKCPPVRNYSFWNSNSYQP